MQGNDTNISARQMASHPTFVCNPFHIPLPSDHFHPSPPRPVPIRTTEPANAQPFWLQQTQHNIRITDGQKNCWLLQTVIIIDPTRRPDLLTESGSSAITAGLMTEVQSIDTATVSSKIISVVNRFWSSLWPNNHLLGQSKVGSAIRIFWMNKYLQCI